MRGGQRGVDSAADGSTVDVHEVVCKVLCTLGINVQTGAGYVGHGHRIGRQTSFVYMCMRPSILLKHNLLIHRHVHSKA